MLVSAGLTAVASVMLVYWVSPDVDYWVFPVVVASLPLVVVGLWMILRYRVGALVLLLLCLPLGRLTLAEVVSPVTVAAAVVLAVWLWRMLMGSERIEFSHMQLPLAIFLLWGIAGIYAAVDVGMAIKILSIFVMGASVYLVASQTVRSPEEAQAVLWGAAVAVGIIGVYAAMTGITGGVGSQAYEGGSYDRVEEVFSSPNVLAGFLALGIPPTAALATSENLWWRRMLGYLCVTAAIMGLAFTYSRGAFLGTGVGLLVLLLVLKRRDFWLVMGLALTAAIVTTGGNILVRLASVAAPGCDRAFATRLEIWGAALRLVAEHPLLGVGLGNFRLAYGDLMIRDLPLISDGGSFTVPPGAHNLFLQLAVEVGLIGASAFAWLLVVAFSRAWQARRSIDRRVRIWSAGLAVGLLVLLVHTVIDVIIYQGFVAILLFAYLGIMDALKRLDGGQAGSQYQHSPSTAPASIMASDPFQEHGSKVVKHSDDY